MGDQSHSSVREDFLEVKIHRFDYVKIKGYLSEDTESEKTSHKIHTHYKSMRKRPSCRKRGKRREQPLQKRGPLSDQETGQGLKLIYNSKNNYNQGKHK